MTLATMLIFPNTREAIQDKIMEWIEAKYQSGTGPLVMWVKGPAGIGKTAIAGSIAERCDVKGYLMASFFFSRFDPNRDDASHLVATIAYQMALNIQGCYEDLVTVVDRDPLIFQKALDVQFTSLIVSPLRRLMESGCDKYSGAPHVIVMDGLDECKDPKFQVRILDMFANLLPQCPFPIRLLVASRPERHLAAAFEISPVGNITTELDLKPQFSLYDDIRVYFVVKFNTIKTTHQDKKNIPSTWPKFQTLTSSHTNHRASLSMRPPLSNILHPSITTQSNDSRIF